MSIFAIFYGNNKCKLLRNKSQVDHVHAFESKPVVLALQTKLNKFSHKWMTSIIYLNWISIVLNFSQFFNHKNITKNYQNISI